MEFALWFRGLCLENIEEGSDELLAEWVGNQEEIQTPPQPGSPTLPGSKRHGFLGIATFRDG